MLRVCEQVSQTTIVDRHIFVPGFTNTLYHFLPIIQLNISFFITLLPFSPIITQQTVKKVLNEVHHR